MNDKGDNEEKDTHNERETLCAGGATGYGEGEVGRERCAGGQREGARAPNCADQTGGLGGQLSGRSPQDCGPLGVHGGSRPERGADPIEILQNPKGEREEKRKLSK